MRSDFSILVWLATGGEMLLRLNGIVVQSEHYDAMMARLRSYGSVTVKTVWGEEKIRCGSVGQYFGTGPFSEAARGDDWIAPMLDWAFNPPLCPSPKHYHVSTAAVYAREHGGKVVAGRLVYPDGRSFERLSDAPVVYTFYG